jgi:hypothetical protein
MVAWLQGFSRCYVGLPTFKPTLLCLAGVEVWVLAQTALGIEAGIPAAATTVCRGMIPAVNFSLVSLTVRMPLLAPFSTAVLTTRSVVDCACNPSHKAYAPTIQVQLCAYAHGYVADVLPGSAAPVAVATPISK